MAEAQAADSEPLRLNWRQTWPEKDADYCAEADGEAVGRIYLHKGGPLNGLWFWSLTASGPEISRNAGDTSGHAPSPREAARMVEEAWFEAIRGTSLAPNAYAAAKAR